MSRADEREARELSKEIDPRDIPGNVTIGTKELIQRWWSVFANRGFGMRTMQHLDFVDISIVPNTSEPSREEGRVVLELTVTKDMLNSAGTIHGACIALFVDLCSTLPIVVMLSAKGESGDPGVTQNISIIYHAPASLGDRLRLINTSTAIGARAWTARTEIWDVTHHRLVASATQVKMGVSWSSKL